MSVSCFLYSIKTASSSPSTPTIAIESFRVITSIGVSPSIILLGCANLAAISSVLLLKIPTMPGSSTVSSGKGDSVTGSIGVSGVSVASVCGGVLVSGTCSSTTGTSPSTVGRFASGVVSAGGVSSAGGSGAGSGTVASSCAFVMNLPKNLWKKLTLDPPSVEGDCGATGSSTGGT